MVRCEANTQSGHRCRRNAIVGTRDCTETIDPISLLPLTGDPIRIQTETGQIHCFNADSFTGYINSRRREYREATGHLR